MADDMTINELAELVSKSFTFQQQYMDGKFAQIDQRFAQIDWKFSQHDEKFASIEHKLQEHDEKFDRIVTILDNHSHMLERLDQERLFTLEYVKRLENDIKRIKSRLKIA